MTKNKLATLLIARFKEIGLPIPNTAEWWCLPPQTRKNIDDSYTRFILHGGILMVHRHPNDNDNMLIGCDVGPGWLDTPFTGKK